MDILQNVTNILVIEHNEEYERFLFRLKEQINGDALYFYTDEDKMTLFKRMSLITSPFDLQITERDIQKKLYSYLIEEIENSEVLERLIDIHAELISSIDKINVFSDYEVEYNDDFSINAILKGLNLKLKNLDGNFCSKIIEYGNVSRNLLGRDCIVIFNCDAFMNREDYKLLEEWVQYNEITLLFIRNSQLEWSKSTNEYIIDRDLCILH